MSAVWKFVLQNEIAHEQLVNMPAGAEIVRVGQQGGRPVMWALVDPTAPRAVRYFQCAFTGQSVAMEWPVTYLGGTEIGPLVVHLFESHRPAAPAPVDTATGEGR